jgi:hypothetical protein
MLLTEIGGHSGIGIGGPLGTQFPSGCGVQTFERGSVTPLQERAPAAGSLETASAWLPAATHSSVEGQEIAPMALTGCSPGAVLTSAGAVQRIPADAEPVVPANTAMHTIEVATAIPKRRLRKNLTVAILICKRYFRPHLGIAPC